ncbi:hypothetical protein [Deinococcus sp.]|uniref:hypothetical protein n=1 Tax=Deinococcus sp. TaxID=47478 RepID=UPI003CC66DB7
MSKQEVVEVLEQKLEQAGVAERAAVDSARSFLADLESGQTLRFADVGELSLQRGKVVVRPAQTLGAASVAPATGSAWQSAAAAPSAPLYTLAAEASIRHLMQGGYDRRDAEVALSSAALSSRP